MMITIDHIRDIATALPGVEERATYGDRPSWRTRRRMFAWVREDPEALVVWVESVEERDSLVASDASKFFTTDHYDNDPILLVRLDGVRRVEAVELITESFRLRAEPSLITELETREDNE